MPHITLPAGPLHKPSIGGAYVSHKLTAAEAAEDVSVFRGDAGFATDDEFLNANAAIAVIAADGDWPPPSFAYRFYPGSPSMRVDHFTSTGRIASGANRPTYTSDNPDFPGEFIFSVPWTNYKATGIAYEGSLPVHATASGGQRMSLNRGVWAWDAGMSVNVKPGSPAAATAGVGFYPSPLLAAEPWR